MDSRGMPYEVPGADTSGLMAPVRLKWRDHHIHWSKWSSINFEQNLSSSHRHLRSCRQTGGKGTSTQGHYDATLISLSVNCEWRRPPVWPYCRWIDQRIKHATTDLWKNATRSGHSETMWQRGEMDTIDSRCLSKPCLSGVYSLLSSYISTSSQPLY